MRHKFFSQAKPRFLVRGLIWLIFTLIRHLYSMSNGLSWNLTSCCLFVLHEYLRMYQLWTLSDHLFLFRVGYKWITRFLALGCYAVLLFPGFIQGLNSVVYNIILIRIIMHVQILIWNALVSPINITYPLPFCFIVGYYYFFSKQIRRSIVYGDKPRNRYALSILSICHLFLYSYKFLQLL